MPDKQPYQPSPTVSLADIDSATTDDERIALLRACIEQENQSTPYTKGQYWAISQLLPNQIKFGLPSSHTPHYLLPNISPFENLTWYLPNRPVLFYRLYRISNTEGYCGHIDIEAHCTSIARHDPARDIHKCLNRAPGCLRINLQVLSYAAHPTKDIAFPEDFDIFKLFHRREIEFVASSIDVKVGRLTGGETDFNWVPPYLASTDGIIPVSTLMRLSQSPVSIPNVMAICEDL